MEKLEVSPNAYYQEKYENNGYIITPLPYACLIWGKENKDEPIKVVPSLEEAEKATSLMKSI